MSVVSSCSDVSRSEDAAKDSGNATWSEALFVKSTVGFKANGCGGRTFEHPSSEDTPTHERFYAYMWLVRWGRGSLTAEDWKGGPLHVERSC